MNVTIIGTGNVATVLGKVFLKAKHTILQVAGRREEPSNTLSNALQCPYTLSCKNINQQSDIYIIAVSDKSIEDILNEIIIPDESIIVHTAGGVSVNVFENKFKNYGVLYPLQSLRKENNHLPEIPFFIDANNEETKNILYDFAKTASDKVFFADDDKLLKLHIAAVLTSNFTNFLYALADDFCAKENIDFKNLLPLMHETIDRLQQFHPSEMQTGPAFRKDISTVEKHLNILKTYPQIHDVYEYLSNCIMSVEQ